MIFIWGKKRVSKRIGFVADFCPMCRCERSFTVNRVGIASHVYYMTFGEGQFAGFTRTCNSCSVALNANPDQYAAMSDSDGSLALLKQKTFPRLAEVQQQRLQIEEQVRANPLQLDPGIRRALIREPLYLIAPVIEARFAQTHFDREGSIALVAFIATIFVGSTFFQSVLPADYAEPAFLAIVATAFIAMCYQLFRMRYRFFERHIYPKLSQTLRPLQPSEKELEEALVDLRQRSKMVARKISVTALLRCIATGAGKNADWGASSVETK